MGDRLDDDFHRSSLSGYEEESAIVHLSDDETGSKKADGLKTKRKTSSEDRKRSKPTKDKKDKGHDIDIDGSSSSSSSSSSQRGKKRSRAEYSLVEKSEADDQPDAKSLRDLTAEVARGGTNEIVRPSTKPNKKRQKKALKIAEKKGPIDPDRLSPTDPFEALNQRDSARQLGFFWANFCAKTKGLPAALMEDKPPDSSWTKIDDTIISKGGEAYLCEAIKSLYLEWKRPGQLLPPKRQEPDDIGCPRIIVITSSALIAVDLIRKVRILGPFVQVAKLFAKHLKVREQSEQLKRFISVGVGTPARINKLVADGVLSLRKCKLILFDGSSNVKRQTIFHLSELRDELFACYRDHLHSLVNQGTRFCFF